MQAFAIDKDSNLRQCAKSVAASDDVVVPFRNSKGIAPFLVRDRCEPVGRLLLYAGDSYVRDNGPRHVPHRSLQNTKFLREGDTRECAEQPGEPPRHCNFSKPCATERAYSSA